jgi:tellurite resistance protein TehA-like permease
MASGIVSVGASLLHQHLLSDITLVVTEVAFVMLVVAYAARAISFPDRMRQALRNPATAMGYFTLVAGTNVLAARLLMAGHPLVTLILGAAASVLWLLLSYGLPWSIMFAARRPVLGDINGTWLIWVVATQSVAIVAAGLAATSPWPVLRDNLPIVAVVLWGVGIMLYLTLIVIIFLRLFLVEITPKEMGPAYWIAMGATAISVRAAAGILAVRHPASAVLLADMHPVLVGLSVILWSFGTWWIPLLVLFGLWRYLLCHYPMAYEPRLWSVVFPLGMYTVASVTLGQTPGLGFMTSIARVWLWVGAAAWAATLVLAAMAVVRPDRRDPAPPDPEHHPPTLARPPWPPDPATP